MRAAELDLDLDVFAGPFDLLMAVVLREEVSLAEVALGEIVVAYLEHLEDAGELDLDAATEFLVLIASLLELKSRLLLPAPEDEPSRELGPEEAADELLARMLEYRRYRDAAAHLSRPVRRRAPLHVPLRAAAAGAAPRLARRRRPRSTSRDGSARRSATCCGRRPSPTPATSGPTVSLERRLAILRALLARRGRFDFDEVFARRGPAHPGGDAVRAARDAQAWARRAGSSGELFGPIQIRTVARRQLAEPAGSEMALN